MPWKMEGEHIAMQDGKPLWIGNDGKEAPFDAEHALNKIGELNSESAARKRDLREAQEKLKVLDGIDNPAEFLAGARKAMETVANLDAKKLIDAGEAERVKAEAIKAVQAQVEAEKKRADDAFATLHREMIGGRFARSEFIKNGLREGLPVDMVESTFGRHFKIEDGKTVAYDANGNKIFSLSRPGELADFDEALKVLVDQYPYKAQILKGSGATGGGAGGGGGHGGGKTTYTREQFAKLGPAEQSDVAAKVRKGEAALAD